jgi:two-component system response regulator YesN
MITYQLTPLSKLPGISELSASVFTHERRRRRPAGSLAQLAKDRIQQDFQSLSLARLASELRVSREHLCRQFKEAFDETVSNYIRRLRIVKARRLIESTPMSLKEIGHKVGYNEYNSFLRAFKRVTAQSPSSFLRDGSQLPTYS